MNTSMTAMGGAMGMAPMETAVNGPAGVAPAGGRPAAQPAPNMVKADVGVGAKGRGYDTNVVSAAVTVPVSTYFASKERVSFQIQIPHAMNLYKASTGHAPKTHQEFMEQIIKAGQIPLPELPPGDEYIYDPTTEQLMVKKTPR
jgi:hypothetical protein